MSTAIDHLWQSAVYVGITRLFAGLVRSNTASLRLRLWMWRIAALKFFLPIAWLYAASESWASRCATAQILDSIGKPPPASRPRS